jgi:hypothetical protein
MKNNWNQTAARFLLATIFLSLTFCAAVPEPGPAIDELTAEELANKQLVESFIRAHGNGDWEEARTYLSDDFVFSGAGIPSSGPDEWLAADAKLLIGIPNLNYHNQVTAVDGNIVTVTSRLTGTHAGELDLTWAGLSVYPPTGNSFIAAEESETVTVENGLIVSWRLDRPADQDTLDDIIEQLGLE